jgi:hypothetical protein
MLNDQLRRKIVCEAARLLHFRLEGDYGRAKLKAARKLQRGWVKRSDLPSNSEVRHEIQRLAYLQEHDEGPKVLAVDEEWSADRDDPAAPALAAEDRFAAYRVLLMPLADVQQPRGTHPEGDVLYHSLQVFELARDARPFDEEFLLAALLHDVGKAIDARDHIAAGLDALDGLITERTAWLIDNHAHVRRIRDGTIGVRARRRLAQSENFEELMLLCECDRDGRVPGMVVPDVEDALHAIREISQLNGETA